MLKAGVFRSRENLFGVLEFKSEATPSANQSSGEAFRYGKIRGGMK